MSPLKHPCDCCGHRTLDQPSGRTGQICPVCFWEDSRLHDLDASGWNGSNGLSLEEAQENFCRSGTCSRDFTNDVRPPGEDEPRDPAWRSVADQRIASAKAIVDLVQAAFAEVVRTEGVLLRTIYAGNDDPDAKDMQLCRRINTAQHWRDLPCEILVDPELRSAQGQFDPASYRFHLPAYLICWLNSDNCGSGVFVFESFLWRWQEMHTDRDRGRLAALNPTQRYVVARFLEHLVRFEHVYREDARKALANGYWQSVLDAGPPAD